MFKSILVSTACVFGAQAAQPMLYNISSNESIFGDETAFVSIGENLTPYEYNSVLFGIAWGFLGYEDDTLLQACLHDASSDVTHLAKAFQDLHRNDVNGIIHEAIILLKSLPNLKSQCSAIGPDVDELKAWAANLLAQPDLEAYIRHNVIRHSLTLTNDLRKAKKQAGDGEYWLCGNTLGTMLGIATQ